MIDDRLMGAVGAGSLMVGKTADGWGKVARGVGIHIY
jgi:hypothetical protein